jgi:hypothetical protein
MPAVEQTGSGETTSPGVTVHTRRTIVATTEEPDGMTLDELGGFLRRAMAAGIAPDEPVRVRANRKGAISSVSVEGNAVSG